MTASLAAERPRAVTARRIPRGRVLMMSGLVALFVLRVFGQLLVTWGGVTWLPAAEHWQSGLIPYPALLVAQLVIMALLFRITEDLWREDGTFAVPRPHLARVITGISLIYAGSMVARYVASMAIHPEWRWFGHSIPIAFHLVLAAYLFLYSRTLAE